jgi:hypothetical protein
MPTPDLDSCLREAKKIPDNTYFRLNVMRFDKVPWGGDDEEERALLPD